MFPPPSPDVQSWHPSVPHVPSTLNSGGAGFAHVDMMDLAWKRRGLFFFGFTGLGFLCLKAFGSLEDEGFALTASR